MTDIQKEFLNELGTLFSKYHIDIVRVGNENTDEPPDIEFWSNNQKLAFYKYTGNKCVSPRIQKSGSAPIGAFGAISTFEILTEYYPKKKEDI